MIKTHLNVEALPYFAADATCVAIATPIQGMKCQIIACPSLSYTPQNLPSPLCPINTPIWKLIKLVHEKPWSRIVSDWFHSELLQPIIDFSSKH